MAEMELSAMGLAAIAADDENKKEDSETDTDDSELEDLLAPTNKENAPTPEEEEEEEATYDTLLSEFPNFRWFMVSYALTNAGEWLTYVASISMLQDGESEKNNLSLSALVVARMVPIAALSPVGGLLADSMDRRVLMTILDVLGSAVSLLFLLSYYVDSHALLYISTVLQMTVGGLYEPSRSAIVKQLVDDNHLTIANTLTAIVWSLMAAVGSGVGGFIVARYGIAVCFLSDFSGYLLSALILWKGVQGNFCVVSDEKSTPSTEMVEIGLPKDDETRMEGESSDVASAAKGRSVGSMIAETWAHMKKPSSMGLYVMVKCSGALTFGASDVLMPSFAKVHEELNSSRLGLLFGAVGIGCLIGPAAVQMNRKEEVASWQTSSSMSFFVLSLGFFGLGVWGPDLVPADHNLIGYFIVKSIATVIRTMGVAVLWIDSSLILQTVTPNELLGRVMAVDLTLATLGESLSAVIAGMLEDLWWQLTAEQIALFFSAVCFIFGTIWTRVQMCYR